jgi:DNA-binding NtrC family response regulator
VGTAPLAALAAAPADDSVVGPLYSAVREFERGYLLRALRSADGKRSRTAQLLGISRKTLWEKLRTSGLAPADGSGSTEGDLT